MSITIVGIHPPRNPENTPILALFDVKFDGLMIMRGCALVEKGSVRTVWGPPLPKGETVKTGVSFTTPMRKLLVEAASEALEALRATKPRSLSAAVALVQQIEARGDA